MRSEWPDLGESILLRGWRDAAQFRHSTAFFWGCEVIGAAIVAFVVALFLVPDNPSRLEAAAYPSVGLVAGFILSYMLIVVVACITAPIRQRNEARQRVSHLQEAMAKHAAGIEVVCSYPVLHKEAGVPPYGDYILVPGLNIVNHTDRLVDCELNLEIRVEGQIMLVQSLESSEIVNAPRSLPDGLRGQKQLAEPIRVAGDTREVGFAAFSVTGEVIEPNWLNVERLNLLIWDGVNHVQLAEHEVWPSIWPEVFDKATPQKPEV